MLLKLQELEPCERLSAKIARACEVWFLQDRPRKEEVTPQTISYLLVKTLHQSAKVAGSYTLNIVKFKDVTRLYEFRTALLVMDFGDERSLTFGCH